MREYTNLDQQIIELARNMILEKGILETDMKDIAKEIGCSRSTLYRHFPSKGDILVVLADQALDVIRQAQIIPKDYRFTTGLEAFTWQLNSILDAILRNVDKISFLRDFDCLYASNYAQSESAKTFEEKMEGSTKKSPLQESVLRGIEDGSIRRFSDPELFVLTVFQTLLALAERVLPEESSYIAVYGYGQEILREHIRGVIALAAAR